MKKLLLVVAVLVLAAPARADFHFIGIFRQYHKTDPAPQADPAVLALLQSMKEQSAAQHAALIAALGKLNGPAPIYLQVPPEWQPRYRPAPPGDPIYRPAPPGDPIYRPAPPGQPIIRIAPPGQPIIEVHPPAAPLIIPAPPGGTPPLIVPPAPITPAPPEMPPVTSQGPPTGYQRFSSKPPTVRTAVALPVKE